MHCFYIVDVERSENYWWFRHDGRIHLMEGRGNEGYGQVLGSYLFVDSNMLAKMVDILQQFVGDVGPSVS